MHILIAEDEVRLTRQIASALTEAGHDPTVVHDGESALREGAETAFDLIVLDLGLPRVDGFEVLPQLVARVRALGRRYPEEPVLNLRVGDLTLDLANHEVYRGTRVIDLSARE